MNKKAQGMPLNTIILAVLALTVLVVLLYIFYGQSKVLGKNVGECIGRGGTCPDVSGKCLDTHPIKIYVTSDCAPGLQEGDQRKNACCLKEP